ncbi:hypothetical protein K458DRAFT_412031 [Lentithecium fluviatile CBS 122367]|uniref:Uncharacterized protein n=1 Tax=Lentithecium fluviatile CBS 122367 TaxID=1168545 RepID=A0A6G1JKK3_9PLEO|nr:hypothetical protein K458DRAFT_412031 [Lentithecium fluviatile CBS 122367]
MDWLLLQRALPPTSLGSKASMRQLLAAAEVAGAWCRRYPDARYAGTVAVVGDLLYYVKLRAEQQGKVVSKVQLNFHGESYGTLLDITFAALYPDRVGRMVLDGMVDVNDWYTGDSATETRLLDAIVDDILAQCYEDGQHCAFYDGDDSFEALKARLDNLMDPSNKLAIKGILATGDRAARNPIAEG